MIYGTMAFTFLKQFLENSQKNKEVLTKKSKADAEVNLTGGE